MNNNEIKQFALDLFHADDEDSIEKILSKHNLWADENWHPLGDNENNYSIIGNQQDDPIKSLVEKIVNSIDAVLMKESLVRNIDPKGPQAPKNMAKAQEKFFNIKDGHLSNVGLERRKELAKNISFSASGTLEEPSFAIVDKGEGQEPDQFKETLLRLAKSAKAGVHFVQGKYGQGGSGALVFGSPKNKLQLIISKRNNEIKNKNSSQWGITLVRCFPPNENQRMEIYKYLSPNNEILSFDAESLNVIPYQEKKGENYKFKPLESGTIIKLYQYNLKSQRDYTRVRTLIQRHLQNQISTLLPDVPIPFIVTDQRSPNERPRTFLSLNMRLKADSVDGINDQKKKDKIIDKQFTSIFNVKGETLEARIYLFHYDFTKNSKDQGRATYAERNEGILLTCNGQTQYSYLDRFFKTKKVGMDVLANSLLVTLEFSETSNVFFHKIFMASRDRIRGCEELKIIEDNLAEILKTNAGLRAAREERSAKRANNDIQKNKSFKKVLENIIKQNKTLTSVLSLGNRLANPYSQIEVPSTEGEYIGEKFPSFFKTTKKFTEENPRPSEQFRTIRVEFLTDASNDYFSRDDDSGKLELFLNDKEFNYETITTYNGKAILNLNLNEDFEIESLHKFTAKLSDIDKPIPLEEIFWVKIIPYKKSESGKSNREKKKPNPDDKDTHKDKKTSEGFSLPDIELVTKKNWEAYDMDEKSALVVEYQSDETGYVYKVNASNIHLLTEIKNNKLIKPEVLQARYALALSLIGMSFLQSKNDEDEDEGLLIQDKIKDVTRNMSLVILPIINSLGIDEKSLIGLVNQESDELEDIIEE